MKEKVYHVPGSLVQKKGEVDFSGSIKVDGGVRGNIFLKARGDIIVGANVDGARMIAGRSIVVGGGITGGEGCFMEAGTTIKARSLDTVNAIANSDVDVESRIDNSCIKCNGRINISKGVVHDSTLCALTGIYVSGLECSAYQATTLTAGVNYKLVQEVAHLKELHERKTNEEQRLLNKLGPMLKKALGDTAYGRKMGQDIDIEISNIRNMHTEIAKVAQNIENSGAKLFHGGLSCISIVRFAQRGCELVLGKANLGLQENYEGPLSFVPDKNGALVIMEKGLLMEQVY